MWWPWFTLLLVCLPWCISLATMPADVNLQSYPDHFSTLAFLSSLHRHYPHLVQIQSIGKSVENLDLLVVRVSGDTTRQQDPRLALRPSVRLIGTVHGNEPLGLYVLLKLASHLVTNYGVDDRVTRLLDGTNIELLPLMNPDGYRNATKGDCFGGRNNRAWNGRENAHGIDLHTNFLLHSKLTEPETLAVMSWMVGDESFVLSASIHTGLQAILYPFHGSQQPTPDETLFHWLAENYVNHLEDRDAFVKGCMDYSFRDGTSIGGKYLLAKNSMPDFSYLITNTLELSLYLSCCKYSNESKLDAEWKQNQESLLRFIESAHMGVKGMIQEEGTGTPIKGAIISVDKYGHNVTSSEAGLYWRLLTPGTYRITVSAYGYVDKTRNVVIVDKNLLDRGQDLSAQIVNFNLTSIKSLEGKKSAMHEVEQAKPSDFLEFRAPVEYRHHNFVAMKNKLEDLAKRFPQISRLYSAGKSRENRDLLVLEISDEPGVHEAREPEFKYVANMHGNEVVGREMLLLLGQLLLEGYGHEERLTRIVNTTRIHLMPSLNPDGYERSHLGDCDSLWGRGNAMNVDLNRNFPDQYMKYEENAKQEPETVAAMKWLKSYAFVLSANLHGGSLVANYPFDGNKDTSRDGYNGTPEDKLFRHLAAVYSYNHPYMHQGRPCRETCGNQSYLMNEYFADGIVNGAKWYSLYGGMQDWNYLHTNCLEITIEMGCYKFPYARRLPFFWRENQKPLLVFLEQVHRGVKGIVRDVNTNASLAGARIHVQGIDHVITSAAPFGDYWRLLLPGMYNITAEKSGYHNKTIYVVVDDRQAALVDFDLSALPDAGCSDDGGCSDEHHSDVHPLQTHYTILLALTMAALAIMLLLSYCRATNAHDHDHLFSRYDFESEAVTRSRQRGWLASFATFFTNKNNYKTKVSKHTVVYKKLNDLDARDFSDEDLQLP